MSARMLTGKFPNSWYENEMKPLCQVDRRIRGKHLLSQEEFMAKRWK